MRGLLAFFIALAPASAAEPSEFDLLWKEATGGSVRREEDHVLLLARDGTPLGFNRFDLDNGQLLETRAGPFWAR